MNQLAQGSGFDPRAALPLVYSCSGCSSAAQLANHLAVRLDRSGQAEMSCIAGVGGGVKPLVRLAQRARDEGRPVLAIDGCPLVCVKACLAGVGVEPTQHLRLDLLGVRKNQHEDPDLDQTDELLAVCQAMLAQMNSSVP